MWENTDQKNSEHGHFSRWDKYCKKLKGPPFYGEFLILKLSENFQFDKAFDIVICSHIASSIRSRI